MPAENVKCANPECGHESEKHYGGEKLHCNVENCACDALQEEENGEEGKGKDKKTKPGKKEESEESEEEPEESSELEEPEDLPTMTEEELASAEASEKAVEKVVTHKPVKPDKTWKPKNKRK